MLKLKEVPQEKIPKAIKNGELIPFHGNHFLLGNSGYTHEEMWKRSLEASETLAQFILGRHRGEGNPHEILQQHLSEGVQYPDTHNFRMVSRAHNFIPKAVHGGGTVSEYVQTSKAMYVPITCHGVRGKDTPLLSYESESGCAAPRGKYAIEGIEIMQSILGAILRNSWRKIIWVIEKENLGASPEAQEVYDHYRQFENQFDVAVFSTHAIDKNGNYRQGSVQDLRFLDGSDQDFKDIVNGHGESPEEALVKSICSYIATQIAHIEREAPLSPQSIKILGHCDLIKLAIHKLLQKDPEISQEQRSQFIASLFAHRNVREMYARLFEVCVEHDVCVEMNVAGYAKGVGIYPSKPLIEIAHNAGATLVLASDAHSIKESLIARSDEYAQTVMDTLPQGASLHTLA